MLHELSFAIGLFFISLIACLTGRLNDRPPLVRSTLVILANWLATIAFQLVTGIKDGWEFNIIIDSLSAFVILSRPASRWQAMIGVAYCMQIAMHGGYGARKLLGGIADQGKYYDALTTVAWVELFLVGVWSGGVWGGRLVRYWFSDRNPRVAAPRGRRLADPRQ